MARLRNDFFLTAKKRANINFPKNRCERAPIFAAGKEEGRKIMQGRTKDVAQLETTNPSNFV